MRPSAPRRQLAQVLLLLFLVLPSLGLSPLALEDITFPWLAAAVILRDLTLLALVGYFVWAEGGTAASIGWRRRGAGHEVLLGALAFAPALLGLALLQSLLQSFGLPPARPPPAALIPQTPGDAAFAVVLLVVVAVVEETLFRGFLLTRLLALTGHRGVALTVATLVFALGHGYQGVTGLIAVAALGLLYGVIYLWRGSLVAPATMHFLQNAAGMLVPWP